MGELSSVRIVGHTDPLGSDAYNLKLSAARAESVKSHMTTLGVPAAVISASGAGESQLKVTEAECRTKGEAANRDALIRCLAPNRRVEITATGSPSRSVASGPRPTPAPFHRSPF
jgi:OOP family OmpA-OmpF porin